MDYFEDILSEGKAKLLQAGEKLRRKLQEVSRARPTPQPVSTTEHQIRIPTLAEAIRARQAGVQPFIPQPPSVGIARTPPPGGINLPQAIAQIPVGNVKPEASQWLQKVKTIPGLPWNPEAAKAVTPIPGFFGEPENPVATALTRIGAGIGEAPVGQAPVKALAAAMETVMRIPGLAERLEKIERKSPGFIEGVLWTPIMAQTGLGAAVRQGAMLAKPAMRLAAPKVVKPLREMAASEAGSIGKVGKSEKPFYYYGLKGDKTTTSGFHEIGGKPVQIKGFEDQEFFIHRPAGANLKYGKAGWTVSEAKTGGKIGSGLTQESAIARAKSNLDKVGKPSLIAEIEKKRNEYGVSPRYAQAQAEVPAVQPAPVTPVTPEVTEIKLGLEAILGKPKPKTVRVISKIQATPKGIKEGDIITHYKGGYKARVDKLYNNENAELTVVEAKGVPVWQRDIDAGERVRIKGKDIDKYFIPQAVTPTAPAVPPVAVTKPVTPVAPEVRGGIKEDISGTESIFEIKTNLPSMGWAYKELTRRGYMKPVPTEPKTLEDALKLLTRETTMEEGRIITISLMPPAGVTRTQAREIEKLTGKLRNEVIETVIKPIQKANSEVSKRFTELVPEIDRLRAAQSEANLGVKGLARLRELEGAAIPKAEAPAVAPGVVKEPWQMTRAEYREAYIRSDYPYIDIPSHRKEVRIALSEGRPVPPEVLKDYPDLAAQVKPTVPITKPVEAVAPVAEAKPTVTTPRAVQAPVAKPVVAPKPVGVPPAKPPTAPPTAPSGIVPPGKPPTVPPGEVPPAPLAPEEVVKEWTAQIKEAKKLRGPTAEAISKERRKRKAIIESMLQRKRGVEARRGAFGAAKGEIPTPKFEPASQVFSQEKAELLQEMIRNHFEKDAYRYLPAQTAFDKLFSGGRIPSPGELTVLEEVFGPDFVKAVLSQRTTGAKAWETFLEVWNIPKALKASYDLSATLRQGAFLIMEGNPAKAAFIAELKAARSEAGFKALNESIVANKWYDLSQGLGKNSLDLTLPRVARGIVGREEPFIGAQLAAKIPIIGKGVRISERAYTGFLNKIRMDIFAKEAEKLSATNAPREAYQKLAWNINILSGRGSLGRFTQAAEILNLPFFSPRFAMSRFQIPLTFATRNPELLKMALRDVAGFIGTVFAVESLLDAAGLAEVEWNILSSDFGKMRIGKTRFDPFAGAQQPVVLVAQVLAGKRKQLETGAMVKVDPTQRVGQFVETKLGPSASFSLALKRGKLYAGKALTLGNALYELLLPITVSDIWEAAEEGGSLAASIIWGVAAGVPATLGIGVQTFGVRPGWQQEFKPYFDIPEDPLEARAKHLVSREDFRKRQPELDAKLFITGHVDSLKTPASAALAYNLIIKNKINPDEIEGIKKRKAEIDNRAQLKLPPPEQTPVDILIRRFAQKGEAAQVEPLPPLPARRSSGGRVTIKKIPFKKAR